MTRMTQMGASSFFKCAHLRHPRHLRLNRYGTLIDPAGLIR
jgi:hypothetical protein